MVLLLCMEVYVKRARGKSQIYPGYLYAEIHGMRGNRSHGIQDTTCCSTKSSMHTYPHTEQPCILMHSHSPNSELWTFDIASRTWSQLPSPPASTPSTNASIAFHNNRLYLVSETSTHYLDLSFSAPSYTTSHSTGPTPLSPWTNLPSATSSTSNQPTSHSLTSLLPITTGQGRNYLLQLTPSRLSTLQLPSSSTTAASLKDRARDAISKKNATYEWAEVRYFTAEGVMVQESQEGRGLGGREGFAATKVKEIDGGCVFVWGGVVDGKVKGDGLMIEVEK